MSVFNSTVSLIAAAQKSSFYIGSFSARRDRLSQWRGYAPNGGVSLGFRFEHLDDRAIANQAKMRKCVYADDDKRRDVETLLERITSNAEIAVREVGLGYEDLISGDDQGEGIQEIVDLAAVQKHGSFEEEDEWRIVKESGRVWVNGEKNRWAFEAGDADRFRFTLCDIRNGTWGIEEVVLWPRCFYSRHKSQVEDVLRSAEIFCDVLQTESPYRPS